MVSILCFSRIWSGFQDSRILFFMIGYAVFRISCFSLDLDFGFRDIVGYFVDDWILWNWIRFVFQDIVVHR